MSLINQNILWDGAVLAVALIGTIYYVMKARNGGELPKIKDIPALKGINEGVGRAAEKSLPVHMTQIIVLFGRSSGAILASLQIAKHIARVCARMGTGLLCHMGSFGHTKALLEETLREGYVLEGKEDEFPEDAVRFHAFESIIFQSAAARTMAEEGCGMYYATEANPAMCVPLEAAKREGAVIVGGSGVWKGMWMYALTADYLLIMEDVFAAGALLSESPEMVSSLAGEEMIKLFAIGIAVLGIILSLMGTNFATFMKM